MDCIYEAGLRRHLARYWFTQRKEEDFGRRLAENMSSAWCFHFAALRLLLRQLWPYGTAKGMSGFSMLFIKDYSIRRVEPEIHVILPLGSGGDTPIFFRWYQWIVGRPPFLYILIFR
jgi:hypothetical protein